MPEPGSEAEWKLLEEEELHSPLPPALPGEMWGHWSVPAALALGPTVLL